MRTSFHLVVLTPLVFSGLACSSGVGNGDQQRREGVKPKPSPHYINSAVFSPDGSILLAIDNNSEVTLWDVNRRSPDWKGKVEWATQARFFADGKRVAMLCGPSLRVWNFQTHQTILSWQIPKEHAVQLLLIAPDQVHLFGFEESLDSEKTIVRRWNVNKTTEESPFLLSGYKYPICACVSADGKTLLLIDQERGDEQRAYLERVDLETGQVKKNPPLQTITAAAFLPGGEEFVASNRWSRDLCVYSVEGQREVAVLGMQHSGARHLAVAQDGKTLVSNDLRDLNVWTVKPPELVHTTTLEEFKRDQRETIMALALLRNGDLLAVAGQHYENERYTPTLRLYDVGSRQFVTTLLGNPLRIQE